MPSSSPCSANPRDFAIIASEMDDARAVQAQLGVRIHFLQASTIGDIDAAFAKVVELRASALAIGSYPLFISRPDEIASLATRYGVPAIHPLRAFATAGGLMSYGSDFADTYKLAGAYVGRILKGEKPENLPVQQSTKVELIINLKTAKVLRLHDPRTTAWTRGRGDRIDRFVAMHESAIASVVVFSRNIPARVVRHEGCRNKAHDRANSDIDRNGIATMVRGE